MSLLTDKYTQQFIRGENLVLAEVIIGSHAFGLETPKSDVDLYGLYYMQKDDFYSLYYRTDAEYKDVVEKTRPQDQDITYMEIGKFFHLLANGNPNSLEILASFSDPMNAVFVDPLVSDIDIDKVISKKCYKSFAEYANSQIKKARGLNKKIVNPVAPERKTPIDFCYLLKDGKTLKLKQWLEKKKYEQRFCGVVALSNAKDSYALYYDWVSHDLFSEMMSETDVEEMKADRRSMGLPMGYGFKGIEMENSNEIRLSSIPKDWDKYMVLHTKTWPNHPNQHPNIEFIGNISYNKDGYIKHCKDYREYWAWVEKRNQNRYENNLKQNYDTKNISHCIRLLSVAREIGEGKGIILRRTHDRQFLLDIKLGNVEYDVAMEYAEKITNSLEELYKNSTLPNEPDFEYLNNKLIEIRHKLYK